MGHSWDSIQGPLRTVGHLLWALCTLSTLFYRVVESTPAVLISSPFDNFRIECPRYSGAQRIGIRMIESQGLKRQDSVFTISCNHISELYPWDQPPEIEELEREDCRYSDPFDPIIDKQVNATCGDREYVAGLARLSDTRIRVQCCRMRTREHFRCLNRQFLKPIGVDHRTEIEFAAKLINSISISNNAVEARFCDLIPRTRASIRGDIKFAKATNNTRLPQVIPFNTPPPAILLQPSTAGLFKPKESDLAEEFRDRRAQDSAPNPEQQSQQQASSSVPPKKIIRIQHQMALSKNVNWETTTTKPTGANDGGGSGSTTANVTPPQSESGSTDQVLKSLMEGMSEVKEQAKTVLARAKVSGVQNIPNGGPAAPQQQATQMAGEMEFAEGMLKELDEDSKNIGNFPASQVQVNTTTQPSPSPPAAQLANHQTLSSVPFPPVAVQSERRFEEADVAKSAATAAVTSHGAHTSKPSIVLPPLDAFPSPPPHGAPAITRQLPQLPPIDATSPNPQGTTGQRSDAEYEDEIASARTKASSSTAPTPFTRVSPQALPERQQPQQNRTSASAPEAIHSHRVIASPRNRPKRPHARRPLGPPPSVDEETFESPFDSRRQPITTAFGLKEQTIEIDDSDIFGPVGGNSAPNSRSPPAQQQQLRIDPTRPGPFDPDDTNLGHGADIRRAPRPYLSESMFNRADKSDAFAKQQQPQKNRVELVFPSSIAHEETHEPQQPSGNPSDTEYTDMTEIVDVPAIEKEPSAPAGGAKQEKDGRVPIGIATIPVGGIMSKDGAKSYEPLDNKPINMPDIIVYDRVDSKNLPALAQAWLNETAASAGGTRVAPSHVVNNLMSMFVEGDDAMGASDKGGDTISNTRTTMSTATGNPVASTQSTPQSSQSPVAASINNTDTATATTSAAQTANSSVSTTQQSNIAAVSSHAQTTIPSQQSQGRTTGAASAPSPTEDDEIVVEGYYWTRRTTRSPPETPAPYDVSQFYQVPKRRPIPKERKETVLTFCSKEAAIRDSSGMVIACGSDNEIWAPSRCPPHSECFSSPDSSYRICCPVVG